MNTATFFADATPAQAAAPTQTQAQSLRGCVEQAVDNYFKHLDGQDVSNVYEMVLAEVEAPMLEIVLKYTRHNQTRAAQVLGLNRGTLRKKLKQYGLL
ncbi:DNA-binding transcriptional regulator Fis [Cellvibrio japonicus]|uniref:Putative Fis-like DNA-binding protein n=1 Tax=Cellvibrio japonicus (strain Ueda107) TaxID=498211 RepID=B3PBH9_CELJU|nr:DNA-binding transcriptional regulator Fis [Cellvibrio japonicus]ACE84642.1 Hin recombinational enhancer binding protein [Cellvibrio japonicus Ueda107]QEI13094.1 DNA-binding transcriptional regulator Fis [Cellvibrio japonicus]QEI16668.1 DNA-binding transcriptional regulator Fis [Cellvibrio japonicus]QEI20246.1 DNA-binding transcriptional regulator Fis [Cellvibrio japonicus]